MKKNCSKLHSILCHFSVSCIVFLSPLFYPTLYDETLSWFIIELALRVWFLFSCSFYTYPAMKVSHLYTNEKDGSIQLRNTSLSPPVFDLGTVADSPSSFCCIPSAPPYFFWDGCVYLISKDCWHGSGFHGNTFQTASVSVMCCCICFSDCVSVRDTEGCSILWTCILTISQAASIKKEMRVWLCFSISVCACVRVWPLAKRLKVIRTEVCESY